MLTAQVATDEKLAHALKINADKVKTAAEKAGKPVPSKARAGIVVKALPDNEGGTPLVSNALRVSHHVFNDEDELARFVAELTAALDDVCAARR